MLLFFFFKKSEPATWPSGWRADSPNQWAWFETPLGRYGTPSSQNIQCNAYNIVRALRNHYITCTVTGLITSWCSRSTQSAAGIKIHSCNWRERLKGHGQSSGFVNNSVSEFGVQRLQGSTDVGRRKHYANARKKEMWATNYYVDCWSFYGASKVSPRSTF